MSDPGTLAIIITTAVLSGIATIASVLMHTRIKSSCCEWKPNNNGQRSLEDTNTDSLKLSAELKEIIQSSKQFDGIELQYSKNPDIHKIDTADDQCSQDSIENNL